MRALCPVQFGAEGAMVLALCRPGCRHAETHFRGSLYTIAALDGMTRKHLQNVIVDACRQSMHECVLCLGHNKGWEEAATSFAVSPTPHPPLLPPPFSRSALAAKGQL